MKEVSAMGQPSYEALYRKWRPRTFEDVISQEHITTTLKNQIMTNKTAHAYIFTGPRGTGKTTCARIFAKALNCKNPKNGNPCLECEICRNADRTTDIIEIDAASNNGVENIREIREGLDYMPEQCAYKVYIIDEVHMLSQAAFNAFLKSIEEPPPHVRFIFATTEIHKVPATILSRCQRFDFHRVRTADTAERIKYIIGEEGLSITDEAARLIAVISDGGMRDALSLLDLCTAISSEITEEVVSEAAGIADRKYISDMISMIAKKDIPSVLDTVNELYENSIDLLNLSTELCEAFRNIMLLKLPAPQRNSLSCSSQEADRLLEAAKKMSLQDAMGYLEKFQHCCNEIKFSVNKRAEFEMSLIAMMTEGPSAASSDDEVSKLKAQIAGLESKIRNLPRTAAAAPQTASIPPPPDPDTVDYSKLRKEDFHPVASWNEILDRFAAESPGMAGSLGNSAAYINQNVMLIVTANRFFMTLFKNKENAEKLRGIIYNVLGKNYIIRAKCTAKDDEISPRERAEKFIENAKNSGIDTAVESADPVST